MSVLNARSKSDIRCEYSQISLILETISISFIAEEQVFSLRVQNKTSCTLLCQGHLIITLLSDTKCECTSQSKSDFLVLALQKCHCKSCIRHYCDKMCDIFPVQIFDK